MGTGVSFPGGKATGLEADNLSQPGAEVKNKLIAPVILHGAHRDLTFTLQAQ